MKTLLMAPELFRTEGGISRILRLYLKALCELSSASDEVRYVALNDGGTAEARIRRYANDRLGARAGCQRRKLRFITASLRLGRGVDRVICGHLHQLSIARLVQLFHPRLDYYLIAHGIDVWRPYTLFEKISLRRARRIFCISEYTRRQMLRFHPALDPARLVVVPNALDPYFTPPDQADAAPASHHHPRLLVVSRLITADTYKGIDTLIEAMPLIAREFPSVQLRIVGGGDDAPRLHALARALQLGDAVHFTGTIDDDDLRAEYAACDLFALPSRKEGFGLVYLEAMTYGKPCLGARAGGAPEVIHDAVGALVEYGSAHQIAAAVSDLVRHPRDAATVRRHADSFAFPAFKQKLAAALG